MRAPLIRAVRPLAGGSSAMLALVLAGTVGCQSEVPVTRHAGAGFAAAHWPGQNAGASATPGDPGSEPPSGPSGTWYLDEGGTRRTLTLRCAGGDACLGALVDVDSGWNYAVDRVRWEPGTGALAFRVSGNGLLRFYHATLVAGVLAGRFATGAADSDDEPTLPRAYSRHVTGWSAEYFDGSLVPRVYDLLLDLDQHARLRLDRDPASEGGVRARIKVYASESSGPAGEGDEYDAEVTGWDGSRLQFAVSAPGWPRTFTARVAGRTIDGTFSATDVPGHHFFSGSRAEVLSHGFSGLSPAERSAWQERTRKQLAHLMMAGDPAPLTSTTTVLVDHLPPFVAGGELADRDDGDLADFPQRYELEELRFDFTLADPAGGDPLRRTVHGFVAVPAADPPPQGFPTVIVLNGHQGSAARTLMPDSYEYWYGDSYARHGYVVLAIDVGHRPIPDRRGLYDGVDWGDDPEDGNGLHPAIASPDMTSDWEEDGERTWDVLRGLDWLLQQPYVDPARVILTGLSLGGEVATFAGAIDPRISIVIAASFSPDLAVLPWRGNHPCWKWLNADIRSYLDVSDLHALIAPRSLIVETGRDDYTFSVRPGAPFAADKQVLRRSRAEWADAPDRLLHYLHYDVHHYHVGGYDPIKAVEGDVRTPRLVEPDSPDSPGWQSDGSTEDTGLDLLQVLAGLFAAG